ncbi:unnamed protein product [Adineta ricciae]|uniref:2-oxoglutarate dehydrogenase, mitochondrial n=1 Tax=Adineta ricciae TaxID=249248 RepID=A0A815RTX6_ADIRI|nr:unnamed protein product [Adineta ricciae]
MERLVSSVTRPRLLTVRCILKLTLPIRSAHAPAKSDGLSVNYHDQMYKEWLNNPQSVHKSWDLYFRSQNQGKSSMSTSVKIYPTQPTVSASNFRVDAKALNDHMAVAALIGSFQTRGHKVAQLDPLGISSIDLDRERPIDLSYQFFNFSEADLNRQFALPPFTFIGGHETQLSLREILRRLDYVYCRTIGIEYMYINNREQCNWIRERFEDPSQSQLSNDEVHRAVQQLIRTTHFEKFLGSKWATEKRFGVEGCDMLIPAMKMVIDTVIQTGVDTLIMGMPHRGRLNVLANVIQKPLEEILCQFNEHLKPSDTSESGDVKYHLGTCVERLSSVTNSKIKYVLLANPSHLEAVSPVVQGRTKAEQLYRDDEKGDKVMSILIHGDAAFAGQGVVYETFHLTDLPAYTTHGTVHIICNNQIGFTTDPRVARSSPYCTDVARVVNAPIFHVNADDPEAVLRVAKEAAEWRCKFKRDVVIDLVGYRRHGHNEVDNPNFTHPYMYKKIEKQTPILTKWTDKLINERKINNSWYETEVANYEKRLATAFDNSKSDIYDKQKKWLDSPWKAFFTKTPPFAHPITGVPEERLQLIGSKVHEVPDGFTLHKRLETNFANRTTLLQERKVDWALAETMALGSLLLDGQYVRFSGQDVERGTFSHRHHVLHDQEKDLAVHVPLNKLAPAQAHYTICNSSLSEFAVLGFELGYAITSPCTLVLWEAQFGDFANNAQCIIDQFLSSGQAKWVRQNGLVLLLPHGYEGQGPEHSSARLERFLQMSAEDEDRVPDLENSAHTDLSMYQLENANWIIAHLTTPANYFHILRRQLAFPFRKPLVLMTTKSLFRLAACQSSFDELIEGTTFKRIYPEEGEAGHNPDAVKKLIFCSGKTYYDLIEARTEQKLESDIAIVRIEQLSPFPFDLIEIELKKYKSAAICFAQEEHKNMGPYSFCKPRLNLLLRKMNDNRVDKIEYAGRVSAAATATGIKSSHLTEQKNYMHQAMKI